MITFDKKIESNEDATIKFIFDVEGQMVEFSYIDNGTDKDIICVPCQTMCNMKCTFCHLTDHIGKIPTKDMDYKDIVEGIEYIICDLRLGYRTILISYMGCGEALANINNVIDSMVMLKEPNIRFGLATMLPKKHYGSFFTLIERVKSMNLPVKVHLSMHFVDDEQRKEWMPSALDLESSMNMLKLYRSLTGNPIEVHYTIMKDVNDSDYHIDSLNEWIDGHTTIKFMMFSEKESLDAVKADEKKLETAMTWLKSEGKIVEYYKPPGNDIGSSCGQFLFELDKPKKDEFNIPK
jgi:adenine C2-methylase RlmN of 23S rRNA A2503 and tRNA A37